PVKNKPVKAGNSHTKMRNTFKPPAAAKLSHWFALLYLSLLSSVLSAELTNSVLQASSGL
ncbi:Uncharacterized protein DAT39_006462, partial [Clarias magur]